MKIFITGGAGFIGSHIADRILARGDMVMVIDNYSTGRRDNLTPNSNLKIVEGSIADTALVEELVSGFTPDVVIHAAASYKDPDNWEEDSRTNVLGTANVVKSSKRAGVKRLIYFQTALGYGLVPEEQPITLKHRIKLEGSSYAISKTAGESYIMLSGMDHISFRLANAYGPRNLSGPLPTFFHRLTTGKKCFCMDTRRDFIYINDLVDVVIKAIDGIGRTGPYHISSGSDYSIKELFDETISSLGITLDEPVDVTERNPDDVYTILLDPSETEKDFNWKVSTPLATGVNNTIEYYKKYGITQTYTHLKQSDKE